MSHDGDRLLDEHVLRRSLRLDADEVPARLDPALIAAAARQAQGSPRVLAVAVAVAFVGGWVWSEAFRAAVGILTAATGIDPLAALIDLVASVAPRVAPITETATHPVVPIAILTAAALAVLFEQRGRAHAASS